MISDSQTKVKGKSTVSAALEELQNRIAFQASVTSSLTRVVSDLTDCVFVDLAKTTLMRRDPYLETVRHGIKQGTLMALQTALVYLDHLFPEALVLQAEREVKDYDNGRAARRDTPPIGQDTSTG